MYVEDTIAAISTAAGEGGIGIVRMSGGDAEPILRRIFKRKRNGGLTSHRFSYGLIVDPDDGSSVDEVMAVIMRGPRSYTREDVVEVQCHGGTLVTERILDLLLRQGARLAQPGEFTKRAFLNGRIDLLQAEAVIDIIRSRTDQALSLAQGQRQGELSAAVATIRRRLMEALAVLEAFIDFPEEDIDPGSRVAIEGNIAAATVDIEALLSGFEEGKVLREGISVLIAGKPNVGKSSLLNTLLQERRAIVTSVPGTTRDIIEEVVNVGGLPVRLMDTAGIRDTDDLIEAEGVRLALDRLATADLVLFVLDNARPFDEQDQAILATLAGKRYLVLLNKTDLPSSSCCCPVGIDPSLVVPLSTVTGQGIDSLKKLIVRLFLKDGAVDRRSGALITRVRHRDALSRAVSSLGRFRDGAGSLPPEVLAIELREALAAIGEVTGQTTSDDILDIIFSQFCIGK